MINTTTLAEIIGIPIWLLAIYLIWELTWKALALWKSAKKNSPIWFVVLLVVNTAGILSILYIYLFSEIKFDEKKNTKIKLTKGKSRRR